MKRKQTAEIADSDLLSGNKPYLKVARHALPYLVRQAKAKRTIYYSELAKELTIPNARNLNYPLGAIGRGLRELSNLTEVKIPPIKCLVVNKRDNLPGEEIGWFFDKGYFHKLDKL